MRAFAFALCLFAAGAAAQQPPAPAATSPEEQRLHATAFDGMDATIASRMPDVQSAVVLLGGRVVYQYHRDGNPEALRDTQSVAKSALAALVGVALQQGRIPSLDARVLELMPEWRALNTDARLQDMTLRHLLAMQAGFAVDDLAGTARALPPAQGWARALRAAPGQSFAYDNSVIPMVVAILEKASGQPLAALAREQLVLPLGMAEPDYSRGLRMRTLDMARLGQLMLQDGVWQGRQLLPPGFAAQLTQATSRGGPPVGLPYGLFWWAPSRDTWFASGYAGQFIWVHPPLGLVVATSSTVSPESQSRGQALQLIRGPLFQAAQKAVSSNP